MILRRTSWHILLVTGIAIGSMLALTDHGRGGVGSSWIVFLVTLLPFLLAAMLGVAKTTTA